MRNTYMRLESKTCEICNGKKVSAIYNSIINASCAKFYYVI